MRAGYEIPGDLGVRVMKEGEGTTVLCAILIMIIKLTITMPYNFFNDVQQSNTSLIHINTGLGLVA